MCFHWANRSALSRHGRQSPRDHQPVAEHASADTDCTGAVGTITQDDLDRAIEADNGED
jgi:hypothetical protein